jgi:hypothetical protein
LLPTWTSKPTLPPDEAQALVMDLIATNGGCRLPCWWGITPGETTWEEARTFLETFATQILTLSKDVYGVTYNNLPESVSRGAVGATITVDNGTVQSIRSDINFPLSETLETYGQPSEVWIKVDPQSINPEAPFTIVLFYPEQGILAGYQGTAKKGTILRFCPEKIIDYTLWFLWDPSLDLIFAGAANEVLINRPFFNLEDKTNMDFKTFYDTYKDPENASICFEMPDPTR